MTDQTPAEMREAAKRLRRRLEISGGTYGDRSDLRASADALDRLALVLPLAKEVAEEIAERGTVGGLVLVNEERLFDMFSALARGETTSHEEEKTNG